MKKKYSRIKVSLCFMCCLTVVFSRDVQAQTLLARNTSYPLTGYEDSVGGTVEAAIAAGVVDAYDTKSFRVKLLSKRKSVYSDSRGARFPCKERPKVTSCAASFPVEGSDCLTKYRYLFRVNPKKKRVAALFQELLVCEDGGYIYSQHSGIARYTVRKR